jgi:hypothetical protein
MPAQPGTAQTFILRVWLEPGAGGGEWRGELKSVPGGESVFFRTWDALPALLRRVVEGEGQERQGIGNRE